MPTNGDPEAAGLSRMAVPWVPSERDEALEAARLSQEAGPQAPLVGDRAPSAAGPSWKARSWACLLEAGTLSHWAEPWLWPWHSPARGNAPHSSQLSWGSGHWDHTAGYVSLAVTGLCQGAGFQNSPVGAGPHSHWVSSWSSAPGTPGGCGANMAAMQSWGCVALISLGCVSGPGSTWYKWGNHSHQRDPVSNALSPPGRGKNLGAKA